jgi:hypothetical protein
MSSAVPTAMHCLLDLQETPWKYSYIAGVCAVGWIAHLDPFHRSTSET